MRYNQVNKNTQDRQVSFTMVPNDIIDFVKLRSNEFAVYVVLLRYDYYSKDTKQSKRFVYPSLRTIKNKSCLSNDKINDALFVLRASGLITQKSVKRTKKDGTESKLTHNIYYLNSPVIGIEALNSKIHDARVTLHLLHKNNKVRSARRNIFKKDVPRTCTNDVPNAGTEKDKTQEEEPKLKINHPPPPQPRGGCPSS